MQRVIRTNGFSLVEVLVAMVVLAVGMLAVARMLASSVQLSGRAQLFTAAGITAQSIAETIRSSCTTANGDSTAGPLHVQWSGLGGAVQQIRVVVHSPSADTLRADTVTAYELCGP